jgi:hypothetical protein
MANTIESALDYWQFLLYSKEDFAKVAHSTNQLQVDCHEAILSFYEKRKSKLNIMQLAQVCINLDYLGKSQGYLQKMVIRRATHGSGKISLDELNSIFNIQSNREDDLNRGDNELKEQRSSFGTARNVSGL